jgi:phosphopantetheine--protein transferase-like protein
VPFVSPGAVRVFSVDLDQPTDVVAHLDLLLPPREHRASARIRVARASTRIVLANALGIEPDQLSISRQCSHCGHPAHGRPTVAGDDRISFNMSHSGSFGVIAIAADDVTVGVDVEEVRVRHRLDALAQRVLNDDEHAAWLLLDDADERLRSFLQVWTAKEAYLKALGIGIATRLRDVPARVEGWHTRALHLGPERVAALCVDRRDLVVEHEVLSPLAMSSGGTAR